MRKKVLESPDVREDIPEDLKELMLKCLVVNESERVSMREVGVSRYILRAKREFE